MGLGFSLGSLHVRYLTLPLMHNKLRISDYQPLLDQLRNRFSSWSSRALSFAGRKQLLSSVICGKSIFGSPLSSCQKGVSKPLSLYALGSFGMAPQHLELLLKSLGQISVSPSMREGLACVI